jgi:hypothetical protein
MSSIITNARSIWRKSIAPKDSAVPSVGGMKSKVDAQRPPFEPVTLAVVGCGQRGKVTSFPSITCNV